MAVIHDERTAVRHHDHQHDQHDGGGVTNWARGVPSERPPRGLLDRRRWTETKWSFKTTELLTLIVGAVGLVITALQVEDLDARGAWTLGVALAIGYMLSRGIAKAGKGTYDSD